MAVKDGFLDVKFSIPAGGDTTVSLCNAIEINPEKCASKNSNIPPRQNRQA